MKYTLKQLRTDLALDVRAARGKVTPRGFVKALVTDPGVGLLLQCRLQRLLLSGGRLSRLAALLLWRRACSSYGCHINLRATLRGGIWFPHPTGIVIGEGVVVASGATIYQNVTLGRKNDAVPDYPLVGRGATIYAGAQVLGAVVVGENAVVGGNAVVTASVPDGATVVGSPARQVRPKTKDSVVR